MSDNNKIELVFDQVETVAPTPATAPVTVVQDYQTEALTERARLTPEEQKQVNDFAEKINLKDTGIVMQYGASAQKKMTGFSENALAGVRSKDLGEVGELLSGLVVQLKSFNTSDEGKGGLLGLFKKSANKITALKSRYSAVETNVGQIAQTLEKHQITLMKDVAMLDKMYQQNVIYFKELTMYILAGKKKLAEVETTELPALRAQAATSGQPEDAQAANDLANLCDRFSKKLHDLELTRTISIQMAPQIRLIQNNDVVMSEKIQSTLMNTIPLWKSQMVLALGLVHSQQAAKAQREVTNMTNELLRKNSEALKASTIATAKEAERGIVDIETLKVTNQNLIDSLDEVVRIQDEGRQRRNQAEAELSRIENDIKKKLLEVRS
ncbi:MAG: toxic anion resistance protein [Peptococcaceae bacterium]|nr:toxic anion resistance protein [Peptococcaceae bacterium]